MVWLLEPQHSRVWWAKVPPDGQQLWVLVPAMLCDLAGSSSSLSLLFPIWENKELKLPHQLSLLLFSPVTPPCFERFWSAKLYLLCNVINCFPPLCVNWGPMVASQWFLVSRSVVILLS